MSGHPERTGFCVLNPGGRDRFQSFREGVGTPDSAGHPPVNFHAYAACLGGTFASSLSEVAPDVGTVLLLLRPRHLAKALRACRALRALGIRVLISWKESGAAQVAQALTVPGCWKFFRQIAFECDGYLSAVPGLTSLYEVAGCKSGVFAPTPYPVDIPAWNFENPLKKRSGILIGTREFDIPARNHLLALCASARTGGPVTVLDSGSRLSCSLLADLPFVSDVVRGPLPYPEYLRLMAAHRIVFQMDSGVVPGQVAGDALLCRMPCVGGTGTIETLAFSQLAGGPENAQELVARAMRLMRDDDFWHQTVAASQETAQNSLSFHVIAGQLKALLT